MKILYATDGLPAARGAEQLLAKVAQRRGAEISTLSVVESPSYPYRYPDLAEEIERAGRARAVEAAETAVKSLFEHGFDATWQTTAGPPGYMIVKTAERDAADLVVLGGGGKSRLDYLLLGSVGTHVLHSSTASVLIVREGPDLATPGRIVVGVDGSEGADAAVAFLPRFIDRARCEVSVIAVAPSLPPAYLPVPGAEMVPHVPTEREELRGRRRDAAEEARERAVATLTEAGFDVTGRVVEGHPVERLLSAADEGGADLIAVGSRGLGPVGRALLGSVSDRVARHARATLVVHPPG